MVEYKLHNMNTCNKCNTSRPMYYEQNYLVSEYKCLNCGNIKYKNNYKRNTIVNRRILEREKKEEKSRIRKQKIKDTKYRNKRTLVATLVAKLGVSATARKLNMPRSSVGLLAKGVNAHRSNRGKFSPEVKELAITIYYGEGNQVQKQTVRLLKERGYKVGRATVQNWINEKANGKVWDQ